MSTFLTVSWHGEYTENCGTALHRHAKAPGFSCEKSYIYRSVAISVLYMYKRLAATGFLLSPLIPGLRFAYPQLPKGAALRAALKDVS